MAAVTPLQERMSLRARTLLHHPQGMGNYFTFKTAIDILGLSWNDVAPGGVYAVTGKGYFDMGYMANHIGPPASAPRRLRPCQPARVDLAVYPPDCIQELKDLVARCKFGRRLGSDFEGPGRRGSARRHRLHVPHVPGPRRRDHRHRPGATSTSSRPPRCAAPASCPSQYHRGERVSAWTRPKSRRAA